MSDSTPSTHLTAELPPDLRWAAVAVHGLAKAGVLEALDRSVPLHRRPGATFADVILYLLLFFGSGQHLGGLRGFFEDFRDLSPLLGALGGRAKLISQSTLSTALAALNRAALVEPLQGFLLEGSGGLDLLRSPAVMTRDAGGRGWHFFDFDPSRTAFRQRMLPDSPELPLARRRLDAIAGPGYAGRKRGEIVATDGLLQHAGSRLWLNVTVDPGNGPRDSFEAALAAVVTTCARLEHSLASALIRTDGEFGWVPHLTQSRQAGIAHLSRLSRYELLSLPDVQARLVAATWERVPDSGSGPARFAADLGEVLLFAGEDTRRPDGSRYEPVLVRVVVSRCPKLGHQKTGAGTQFGDELIEMFVSSGLSQAAWSAAAVVEIYYARNGQECQFALLDREFGSDTLWSSRPTGQLVALVCSCFIWNKHIVEGWKGANNPLPPVASQNQRVVITKEFSALQLPDAIPPAPKPSKALPDRGLDWEDALEAIKQQVARRLNWRWDPTTLAVITPDGTELRLRGLSEKELRFMSDSRTKQAAISIAPSLVAALRAGHATKLLATTPASTPRGRSGLITAGRDDLPPGLETGWPTFLPAEARRLSRSSIKPVSVTIELVIVEPPSEPLHPLVSPLPRSARHRRLSLADRTARNAISPHATLTVTIAPLKPRVRIERRGASENHGRSS